MLNYAVKVFVEGRGDQDPQQLHHGDAELAMEDAFRCISAAAGHEGRVPVPAALAFLRGLGSIGRCLASRCSSLSRRQNAVAHPDVWFRKDLEVLLLIAGAVDKAMGEDGEVHKLDLIHSASGISGSVDGSGDTKELGPFLS